MKMIDVHASIFHPSIDTSDYKRIDFCVPVYGGKYPRGATAWELECLNVANSFLSDLFAVPGFSDFFASNHYCVKKEQVISYLIAHGSNLSFPTSREYHEPFTWQWCQLEGGANIAGHIMDRNGWLYDKLVIPNITISVDSKCYRPFNDWEQCFSTCVDNNEFAWKLCEASAYNAPYLYSLVKKCNHNIEYLYEGGFTADMDRCLSAVLEYFDQEILPTYNVIVDEDTVSVNKGKYQMHIVDISSDNLKGLVRRYKKEIRGIIESYR